MNPNQFNILVRAFESSNCMSPVGPIARSVAFGVIEHGLKNGFFELVEQKNPYTFGGVTAYLTDSQLATIMGHLQEGQKIQAIKALRVDFSARGLSLKEAKDFADHLGNVINKMPPS